MEAQLAALAQCGEEHGYGRGVRWALAYAHIFLLLNLAEHLTKFIQWF